MKKVVKLTERDLTKLVKQIINEDLSDNHWEDFGFEDEESFIEHYIEADDYAFSLSDNIESEIMNYIEDAVSRIDFEELIRDAKNDFKRKYGQYYDLNLHNENIDDLKNLKSIDPERLIGAISEAVSNEIYHQNK
tara:strand:- start:50 stop:454 length:405 start_codon:yes stop_codon:yes gene_type:complete